MSTTSHSANSMDWEAPRRRAPALYPIIRLRQPPAMGQEHQDAAGSGPALHCAEENELARQAVLILRLEFVDRPGPAVPAAGAHPRARQPGQPLSYGLFPDCVVDPDAPIRKYSVSRLVTADNSWCSERRLPPRMPPRTPPRTSI
ncbi:hypothetical protein B0H21DRAFT_711486 [Amylocystis lapponica]|nr:hypothetical protein B0H21DRAFT_711486 [Amylocystis lapponica]